MENNFFGWIPSQITFDKRVKNFESRLYPAIAALTNQEGYCWATNAYFAEQFDVSESTISKSISNLEKLRYLTVAYDEKARRKIYLNLDFIRGGVVKNYQGGSKNLLGGVVKNYYHNNNKEIKNKEKDIVGQADDPNFEIVLKLLSEGSGVKYKKTETSKKEWAAAAKKFAKAGADFSKIILVAEFLCAKWGEDDKMREYLRLSSLLVLSKFEERLAQAEAWEAKGKPALGASKQPIQQPQQAVFKRPVKNFQPQGDLFKPKNAI